MRAVSGMILLQDREAVLAHFRELKGEMTASRDLERFALVLPSIANTTKNILSRQIPHIDKHSSPISRLPSERRRGEAAGNEAA